MKNKMTFIVSISLLVASLSFAQSNERIYLIDQWKFQTGDKAEFSKPDFDDRSWKKIWAGDTWENQGYQNYDGIGWYRLHIVIPSTLKRSDALVKSILISLGKIDDNDITFINGKKIGETNGYDAPRTYLIPYEAINWDKENCIAVRVNDIRLGGGMNRGTYYISNILLSGLAENSTNDKTSENSKRKIDYKVESKLEPLSYGSQKIHGFFGDRMNLNMNKGLEKVPYYSYLRAYTSGVESFWPAGEFLGKFSQALMKSYQYTNDQSYLEQTQKIIDKWIEAQEDDGYIATNPEGYSRGARWDDWSVWEHKYVLLGMLDYYELTGEKRVLESAKKAADVVIGAYGSKDTQLDLMATGNTGLCGGSILEPMTYLYQYTGDSKYLDFCIYILKAYEQENGPKIISELTERSGHVGKVGTGKGYEMLSCIIGIVKMYQLTGNQKFIETAKKAWEDIIENELYVTGTATQHECFHGNKHLPADEKDQIRMGEGCVTAHWIILNRLLFQLSGDLKYIEEIEKSLLNHLLASQSASTGMQSYYSALIGHKQFMKFDTYGGMPPCCLSSVQRCISTIPEVIWEKFTDNGFAILMYNSGEFSENTNTRNGDQVWVNLKIEADVMGSGTAKIVLDLKESIKGDLDFMDLATAKANRKAKDAATFLLALRVPSWSKNFKVQLSDGTMLSGKSGEYLNMERAWSNNELINISMDVVDQVIEGSPTYKGFYALKHGPYILALDQALNQAIDIDQVKVANPIDISRSSQSMPKTWIGNQVYSIESIDSQKLILTPFLDVGQHGSKYRVWIPSAKR